MTSSLQNPPGHKASVTRYGHIYDPIASGGVSFVLSFSMSDDADKEQRLLEKGCKHVLISQSYIKVGQRGN